MQISLTMITETKIAANSGFPNPYFYFQFIRVTLGDTPCCVYAKFSDISWFLLETGLFLELE